MSRLENIIARNQQANRPHERVVVSLIFGGIILLVLALMVFTDLGKSPEPTPLTPDSSRTVTPSGPHDKHVDGILLRKPAHPAPAPGAAPAAPTSIPAQPAR